MTETPARSRLLSISGYAISRTSKRDRILGAELGRSVGSDCRAGSATILTSHRPALARTPTVSKTHETTHQHGTKTIWSACVYLSKLCCLPRCSSAPSLLLGRQRLFLLVDRQLQSFLPASAFPSVVDAPAGASSAGS